MRALLVFVVLLSACASKPQSAPARPASIEYKGRHYPVPPQRMAIALSDETVVLTPEGEVLHLPCSPCADAGR